MSGLASPEAMERWFARWATSQDELLAAFGDAFAPSGEWYAGPPPIPVTHGPEEAVGLLQGFRRSHDLTTIKVDLLQVTHTGNVICNERIDHLMNSQGEEIIGVPLAGVFVFDENGLITYWRDYWDMHDFNALPLPQ